MEYILIALESQDAFEIRKDPKRQPPYFAQWKRIPKRWSQPA